jgi:hypothetical protein
VLSEFFINDFLPLSFYFGQLVLCQHVIDGLICTADIPVHAGRTRMSAVRTRQLNLDRPLDITGDDIMKKMIVLAGVLVLCTFVVVPGWADTLEMKDGRLIEGKYMGGTQNSVRFQVKENIAVYPVREILAVTFASTLSSSPQEPARPPQTRTPQPTQSRFMIPSGTRLPVRMLDTLDIKTNERGDWFKATLESDLILNGTVVVPKGTNVNGQVVEAERGRYETALAITLRELIIQEQVIPITTKDYIVRGKAETVLDVTSLKIVTRERPLQIPYRSIVEFETTTATDLQRVK